MYTCISSIEVVQHSALTKKGLRQADGPGNAGPGKVQHSALTKKGLRQNPRITPPLPYCSALCPDEEGIKTGTGPQLVLPMLGFSTLP